MSEDFVVFFVIWFQNHGMNYGVVKNVLFINNTYCLAQKLVHTDGLQRSCSKSSVNEVNYLNACYWLTSKVICSQPYSYLSFSIW